MKVALEILRDGYNEIVPLRPDTRLNFFDNVSLKGEHLVILGLSFSADQQEVTYIVGISRAVRSKLTAIVALDDLVEEKTMPDAGDTLY